MPSVVFFDCYGVLCDEIANVWARTHTSEDEWREIEKTYGNRLDLGEITDEEFFEGVGKVVGRPADIVRAEWVALAQPKEDVLAIVDELRARHRVVVLSNAGARFFEDTTGRFNVRERFDDIIVSAEVRLMKPDPSIFALALKRSDVGPAEAVFVDDRIKNVEAAQRTGIRSFLFTDSAKLRSDLAGLGML